MPNYDYATDCYTFTLKIISLNIYLGCARRGVARALDVRLTRGLML